MYRVFFFKQLELSLGEGVLRATAVPGFIHGVLFFDA